MDAGRAGINRVRGYGNVNNPNIEASSSDEYIQESSSSISNNGLHRRRGGDSLEQQSTDQQTSRNESGNQVNDGSSIAGLLGLDEEFRIIGSHKLAKTRYGRYSFVDYREESWQVHLLCFFLQRRKIMM